MSNQPVNSRTVTAIETMMQEMQFLVDHPRMQQRNWVAKGKEWLPILQHAKEDLERDDSLQRDWAEAHQAILMALARLGLKVVKRDETSWGYSLHGDILIGSYPTRADAIEAGLRARLKT